MISRAEIEKLAKLSRLKLSAEEIDRMQGEMGAILGYVDKLKEATASGAVVGTDGSVMGGSVMSVNKNVMRQDANAHEPGINTEKLLDLAPRRKDAFVQVKKIL